MWIAIRYNIYRVLRFIAKPRKESLALAKTLDHSPNSKASSICTIIATNKKHYEYVS